MTTMSTVTTAPARAAKPQHMRALQHANRVRIARADLKRAVRAGESAAAEIIFECPWEAETMPIGELLRSQRRWGNKRVTSFLRAHAVSETRLIGQLTERQRGVISESLPTIARPTANEALGGHSGGFEHGVELAA